MGVRARFQLGRWPDSFASALVNGNNVSYYTCLSWTWSRCSWKPVFRVCTRLLNPPTLSPVTPGRLSSLM